MDKAKKRRSLSVEIIIIFFGISFAVGLSTTALEFLVVRLFSLSNEAFHVGLRYSVPIAMAIDLFLIAWLINRLLAKRITALSKAAAAVKEGRLSTTLKPEGNDQLSDLMADFNAMVAALNAKGYLNLEFTRNVSHEFKTPLAVIRGDAELILEESQDPEVLGQTQVILEEVDRLNALSLNLLILSQLDDEAIIPQNDSVTPARQIRTILQETETLWEEKEIEWDLELEDFEIQGNEKLLYCVWQNLISNALKFSFPKGQIRIELKKEGEGFRFAIIDHGIGISEEEQGKLFQNFFVGGGAKNPHGSGLGLALSKKIVERFGGTLSFESKGNEGSRFTAAFPASFSTEEKAAPKDS